MLTGMLIVSCPLQIAMSPCSCCRWCKITQWLLSGYVAEGGGPITRQGFMDCDFEGECCYRNAIAPEDKLEWRLVEGTANKQRAQLSFNINHGRTPSWLFGNLWISCGKHYYYCCRGEIPGCHISRSGGPVRWSSFLFLLNFLHHKTNHRFHSVSFPFYS